MGTQTNLVTNEYTTSDDAPTPVGWVKKQTHADGGVYQFAYNVVNGKSIETTITEPRGTAETPLTSVRRVTFNPAGYVLTDTHAVGTADERTTTSARPGADNFIATSTDTLGAKTASMFDALGNVTSITRCLPGPATCTDTSPGALTTRYTYEPRFNQLASVTNALNHTTTYEYNGAGNLEAIVDPLQHRTTMTHNAQGQVTSVTDAMQHTTTFGYAGGDLVTVIDALNQVTTRFTDAGGRVLSTTNPLGQMRRFTYDGNGRITRVTEADGSQASFVYFPGGNLQSVTDANQHTTTYTYDLMGRLRERTDPLQRVETFKYELSGELSYSKDAKGQEITRTYDALNRLRQITFGSASSITYTYDGRNRLRQISDSAAVGPIVRDYDDMDRLLSETTPAGVVSYTYDDADRRATMTVSGQQTVEYTFDAANRLTGIARGGETVIMGYDNANRRTSMTLPNGVAATYGYDDASRRTEITYARQGTAMATLIYTYDGAGNVVAASGTAARVLLPQAVGAATYDAANQMQVWGELFYSHDANGNRSSDGMTSYVWDERNRLTSAFGAAAASYLYDGAGRRSSKTIQSQATSYRHDGTTVVAESSSGIARQYLGGTDPDEILLLTAGANSFVRLADGSNSTLAWIGSTGSAEGVFSYAPFGASAGLGTALVGAAAFTGRELDIDTQYYYRARYYDATSGRFMSSDPIEFAGGLNTYQYAVNNPLKYRDPNGLDAWLSGEGNAGLHFGLVGVNGSVGLVFNPSTWETCAYVMGCARPGIGMFAGAGAQLGGSILGPHCGKDLNGRAIKVALDITSPVGGVGVSAGQNNGAGVSVAVKPNIGAGFSAGVDICQMKILKCWNTPSDCKPCSK